MSGVDRFLTLLILIVVLVPVAGWVVVQTVHEVRYRLRFGRHDPLPAGRPLGPGPLIVDVTPDHVEVLPWP